MSNHATKFLDRKETLEQMENYSVIMIFGSKENPTFLPCHITNKMFVREIARQYNYRLHFFHGKSGTSCSGTSTRLTNLQAISTT
jgi:hypothetical protein